MLNHAPLIRKAPYASVVLYVRCRATSRIRVVPTNDRRVQTPLQALGYRWVVVTVYRDDAKSVRYLRKAKGRVERVSDLRDLKTGNVVADLILSTTLRNGSAASKSCRPSTQGTCSSGTASWC
jgi:hypothetical protein